MVDHTIIRRGWLKGRPMVYLLVDLIFGGVNG